HTHTHTHTHTESERETRTHPPHHTRMRKPHYRQHHTRTAHYTCKHETHTHTHTYTESVCETRTHTHTHTHTESGSETRTSITQSSSVIVPGVITPSLSAELRVSKSPNTEGLLSHDHLSACFSSDTLYCHLHVEQ